LLVIGLVSASLIIITVDYRSEGGLLDDVGGAVSGALAPMQEGVTAVVRPVGDFFSGLANLPSLADENARLKEEVADLQAAAASFQSKLMAYDSLLRVHELTSTLDPEGVPAVVIASGVGNFEWTVTIDAGADDGIEAGMPVVTGGEEGARLVGTVVSTTSGQSMVQLIIDPDHAVHGVIGASGRNGGLVVGAGESDMRMEYVARVDPSLVGEEAPPVFTASYDIAGQVGRYPPHLLIGTVSSTLEENNQVAAEVTVRPAVDFSSLQFVLVLRSKNIDGSAT
jgi:rod shape-determining protein MreC